MEGMEYNLRAVAIWTGTKFLGFDCVQSFTENKNFIKQICNNRYIIPPGRSCVGGVAVRKMFDYEASLHHRRSCRTFPSTHNYCAVIEKTEVWTIFSDMATTVKENDRNRCSDWCIRYTKGTYFYVSIIFLSINSNLLKMGLIHPSRVLWCV